MTFLNNVGNFLKTNTNNGNLAKMCNIIGSAAMNAGIASALLRHNNSGINCIFTKNLPDTLTSMWLKTPYNPIEPIGGGGLDNINNPYGLLNRQFSPTVFQPFLKTENPQNNKLPNDVSEVLNSEEFAETIKSSIPDENYRKAVLEILSGNSDRIEIVNEGKNGGAARYDSNSKKIIINGSVLNNTNKDDLIKILVHESMHAAQNTSFNTQEEELLCESTAIRTRADLISKGKCDDEKIYGKTYTELNQMSDEELISYLKKNFIGSQTPGHFGVGAYSNRIIDKSGAVTIHDASGKQIPLAAGSKLTIGDQEYTLGKDIFIEGIGAFAGTTCQLFKLNEEGKPITLGIISFDGLQRLPFEDEIPPIKKHLSALNSGDNTEGSIKSGKDSYNFKITDYNSNI